jgi:phosphoribosyl-ATP pyrophosphohydrolase/phosphoribosyl-AMP cyclohydrolase
MTAQLFPSADTLDFSKGNGLVTVVTQDATTGDVLMVAHMDREAFEKTVETGEMHYRSRTRGLWHKGATSGNTQRVVSLTPDCDQDAILARVIPTGPACHTGSVTCFNIAGGDVLSELASTIETRATHTTSEKPSYTQRLLSDRNLRLKKLGEECVELVTALADGDRTRMAEEGADILYHTLVALRAAGVTLNDVRNVLSLRRGQ